MPLAMRLTQAVANVLYRPGYRFGISALPSFPGGLQFVLQRSGQGNYYGFSDNSIDIPQYHLRGLADPALLTSLVRAAKPVRIEAPPRFVLSKQERLLACVKCHHALWAVVVDSIDPGFKPSRVICHNCGSVASFVQATHEGGRA